MNWAWFEELRDHKHPAAYRAVGLALAIRAKNDNPVCYPSYQTLCKDASVCRMTVLRAIEQFESEGLIEVERTAGKANRYVLASPSQRLAPVHERDGYQFTMEMERKARTRLSGSSDPSTIETRKGINGCSSLGQESRGHCVREAEVPY